MDARKLDRTLNLGPLGVRLTGSWRGAQRAAVSRTTVALLRCSAPCHAWCSSAIPFADILHLVESGPVGAVLVAITVIPGPSQRRLSSQATPSTRWRFSCCSCCPTRAATSPAPRWRSTVGGRCSDCEGRDFVLTGRQRPRTKASAKSSAGLTGAHPALRALD